MRINHLPTLVVPRILPPAWWTNSRDYRSGQISLSMLLFSSREYIERCGNGTAKSTQIPQNRDSRRRWSRKDEVSHKFLKDTFSFMNLIFSFSLLTRYCSDTYDPESNPTMGVDFREKTMVMDGNRIKITFWGKLLI